jgi:hypothetical protein
VASDVDTGVASRRQTRSAALENPDGPVALDRDEIGRNPMAAELREGGIEGQNDATGEDEPRDLLK